ncbi:chaperone modulator CbpM [Alkalimarinus alittae]|uniref:Chaperone modulator CbpM n=1 Tax=Alkalimarinus alittae TaxID=2961619 RepID=A0ABY6MZZ1_9ALTE|nr:chaperone modulator CbpM [Alkalimarinus alittae]UZE95314.1 chaperone modulator CbpM [Alkalimarinus alittae]
MTEISFSLRLNELCQLESIEPDIVIEIVEYGIAQPVKGENTADWVFDTTTVHWIKKAVRLHQDLEIDWVAVAMVIDLMQQKESLLRENEHFQCQLKRFLED